MSDTAALDLAGLIQGALLPAHGAQLDLEATPYSFATLLNHYSQAPSGGQNTAVFAAQEFVDQPGQGLAHRLEPSQLHPSRPTAAFPITDAVPEQSQLALANASQQSRTARLDPAQMRKTLKALPSVPGRAFSRNTELPGIRLQPQAAASLAPRESSGPTGVTPPIPVPLVSAGQIPGPVSKGPTATRLDGQTTENRAGAERGATVRTLQLETAFRGSGDPLTQGSDSLPKTDPMEKLTAIGPAPAMKFAQSQIAPKERSTQARNKLVQAAGNLVGLASDAPQVSDRPLTSLVTESAQRPTLNTQSLATDIASLKFSGQNQARVSLRPSHLGEVEIRLKVTQTGTSIELIAASDTAADLLNQSLPTLRAQLAGAGIQASAVEVSADSGASEKEGSLHAQEKQSNADSGGQRAGQDESPEGETLITDNVIDLASINRQSRLLDARA